MFTYLFKECFTAIQHKEPSHNCGTLCKVVENAAVAMAVAKKTFFNTTCYGTCSLKG